MNAKHFIVSFVLIFAMANECFSNGSQPVSVTLRDYLGGGWNGELVHYDLSFPPHAWAGGATAMVEDPQHKPIPSQLSDIQRDENDGSIRACRIWFLATVPPNGSATYTIWPGRRGPATPSVHAAEHDNGIELLNGGAEPIGIRLPRGEKRFEWPTAASNLPGPIQALLLPNGQWVGGENWTAPFKVRAFEAALEGKGPIFAEARVRYEFDNGYWVFKARVLYDCPMLMIDEEFDTGLDPRSGPAADRFYDVILTSDAFKPTEVFFTGRNDAPELETLLKAGIHESWREACRTLKPNWFISPVNGFALPLSNERDIFFLTGYPSVIPRVGCLARAVQPGGCAIGLAGLNTAKWRTPLSIRWHWNRRKELVLRFPIQAYKQDWTTDGFGWGTPNYTGQTLGVPDTCVRRSYGIMLSRAEDETKAMLTSLFSTASKLGHHPLDEVKDWILDWPDPMASNKWADSISTEGSNAMSVLRDRILFKERLGNFGRFSMGYHYGFAKQYYSVLSNALDNTNALTAADRREARRLAAWLAYDMHSVDTFPWGTGFHLNNPNMSIMAIEARVKAGLLVKDHPMREAWNRWSLEFARDYIERFTRPSGATYENPHYTLGVTMAELFALNRTLLESGVGDALDSPRFRRSMDFIMDWLSPPDPRFLGHRMILPLGNCSYQSVPPEFAERAVEYYRERDPSLAGKIQWFANQTLPSNLHIKIVSDSIPHLESAWHKDDGVSFRHGFGTPYETLLRFRAGDCDGHYEWESDQMCYTLYAKGQPIHLHFGNGYFPMFCRPWLRNRVSIAHQYEIPERNQTRVLEAMFSPDLDYAKAARDIDQIRPLKSEYPLLADDGVTPTPEEMKNWSGMATNIETIPLLTWFRQILFLKDPDPAGPNYFVIRDSFGGISTKPTDLSLWFLADTMTRTNNYFHFDGQCEADMDLFVCTPETPKFETGSYGHKQQPYGRKVGFDPKYFPGGNLCETQMFFRVHQPAGKDYLVVLYPRLKQNDPPAGFTRLADSAAKIETPISTDYVFLFPFQFEYKDDILEFSGAAAAVRFHKDSRITIINAENAARIKVGAHVVAGRGPFLATVDRGAVSTRLLAPDAVVEAR